MIKVVIFLALIGLSFGRCPHPDLFRPCVCDEPNMTIECKNIRGRFNLKQIFDNASAHMDTDIVFDKLDIFDTPLLEIEDDAIQHLKFTRVDISSNRNLVYISPRMFNASRKVTKQLEMWMNFIDNENPYERDIFDFISGFENLERVWMPTNRLTSVPDNAFQNLNSLTQIYLGSNGITQIGSRAFAGVPNLKELWMSHNGVPSEGLLPDVFDGIGSSVEIDLTYNRMDHLDQASFQTLLDRAAKVHIGGGSCGRNGCSYQYLYCDERADWICDKLESYQEKLTGFRCYSGAGVANVWEYCEAKANGTVAHIN